jgi:hypothetical protein
VGRIDSLKRELGDVETESDALITKELSAVNKTLAQKKLEAIQPLTRKAWDTANSDSGAGAAAGATFRRERD